MKNYIDLELGELVDLYQAALNEGREEMINALKSTLAASQLPSNGRTEQGDLK